MMVNLFRHHAKPLDERPLFGWHKSASAVRLQKKCWLRVLANLR